MKDIVVYGAGGHGKVIVDALRSGRIWNPAYVVDDDPERQGSLLGGLPVRAPSAIRDQLLVVAIGLNQDRLAVASRYRGRLATVAHRTACIAPGVEIGEGTVVLAAAVVNTGARIGANAIVNTAATVDHDCEIEDGVHVAPGCHLCGSVRVGAGSLLGVGTVVTPGVRIGRNVLVAAGGRITRDVPDGAIVRAAA